MTDSMKILLKKIGEKSMGYRWMSEKASMYYDNKDKKFMIAIVIFGSLLAILDTVSLYSLIVQFNLSNNKDFIITLTVINLIFVFMSLILTGIRENSGFRDKSNNHRQMLPKYAQIYHSIQEQFSLSEKDQEDGVGFLRDMIKDYDNLLDIGLNIPSHILDQYAKATKNNDITKPAIIGEIAGIEITSNDAGDIIINVNDEDENENNEDNKNEDPNSKNNKLSFEIQRWMKMF